MLPVEHLVVAGVRCVVYDSAPQRSQASQTNGEAVVFVHGNPGPSDDWETLAPAVGSFARSIAMDLPGFGRAEHPYNFDFSIAGYARYLGELLDQLGVTRAHLVLHDFGGPFGLAWMHDKLDKLASVTLINTGSLRGFRWHRAARMWQTPLLGELVQLASTPRVFARALQQSNPRPLPAGFTERVSGYMDWAHKHAVLKLYRATRDIEAVAARYVSPGQTIDRPACVIWGAADPFLPVKHAEREKEVFPRAEVHVLPGLGHWPFVDDPQAVLGILLPFLQAHVGSWASPSELAGA